jgi:uncharacterized membrane protein YdfJ with MMPL/SSD domain
VRSDQPTTDVKVFATGLACGILLDATVVRMLLVLALVSLFGDWNLVSARSRGAPPAHSTVARLGS